MDVWPIIVTEFPKLERLNFGQRFTKDSGVSYELLNNVVLALLYLNRSGQINLREINEGFQFTSEQGCAYEDLNLIVDALKAAQQYSGVVDTGETNIPTGWWAAPTAFWYSLRGINEDAAFAEGSGVTYHDWNTLVEDLLYLKDLREIFVKISAVLRGYFSLSIDTKQAPTQTLSAPLQSAVNVSAYIQSVHAMMLQATLTGVLSTEMYMQALRAISLRCKLESSVDQVFTAKALNALDAEVLLVGKFVSNIIANIYRAADFEMYLNGTSEFGVRMSTSFLESMQLLLAGSAALSTNVSMATYTRASALMISQCYLTATGALKPTKAFEAILPGTSNLNLSTKKAAMTTWSDIPSLTWEETTNFGKLFYHIIT